MVLSCSSVTHHECFSHLIQNCRISRIIQSPFHHPTVIRFPVCKNVYWRQNTSFLDEILLLSFIKERIMIVKIFCIKSATKFYEVMRKYLVLFLLLVKSLFTCNLQLCSIQFIIYVQVKAPLVHRIRQPTTLWDSLLYKANDSLQCRLILSLIYHHKRIH